jgi:GNAT superfamily N-acetyltransferase
MKEDIHIIQGKSNHSNEICQMMLLQFKEHAIDADEAALNNVILQILEDNSQGLFLIAESMQRMVGVAYLAFVSSLEHQGKCAWLEELFVVPDYRRRGVGGLLIDAALQHATRQGCNAVDLEVMKSHRQVEKLYQRKGFKKLERNRWVMVLDRR